MKCPQCIESLGKSGYKGFGARSCLYCDGVWVSNDVLLEMLAKAPLRSDLDAVAAAFQGECESVRLCPSCGETMRKSLVKNIELDFCMRCQGIFFDQGELSEFAPNIPDRSGHVASGIAGYAALEVLAFMLAGLFGS
jgi:Zn-finger nucleic acid-binding protein